MKVHTVNHSHWWFVAACMLLVTLVACRRISDGDAEALLQRSDSLKLQMNYDSARWCAQQVATSCDNQFLALQADVRLMHLAIRQAQSKDFYLHRTEGEKRLLRIQDERQLIGQARRRELRRARIDLLLAGAEYYLSVDQPEVVATLLDSLEAGYLNRSDTLQQATYFYLRGQAASAPVTTPSQRAWHLAQGLTLSQIDHQSAIQARILSTFARMLAPDDVVRQLGEERPSLMNYLGRGTVPDSLLALTLAEDAEAIALQMHDAELLCDIRATIGFCLLQMHRYEAATDSLERLLRTVSSIQAPALQSQVHEWLSVCYSMQDHKTLSDVHRNAYLDLLEVTRQDRELESRHELLARDTRLLRLLLWGVVLLTVLVIVVVVVLFVHQRRNLRRGGSRSVVLQRERLEEALAFQHHRLRQQKQRQLDHRAKAAVLGSMLALIGRLLHALRRGDTTDYPHQLLDGIEHHNDQLTEWIRLTQGRLSLHVEAFPLEELFAVLRQSTRQFELRHQLFLVCPTDVTVTADRVLTLFMLNTLAENAGKFTPQGGHITIQAHDEANAVRITIQDDGPGLTSHDVTLINTSKVLHAGSLSTAPQDDDRPDHGFGLMNCHGIIEKYRKMGPRFDVCTFGVDSQLGRGSTFFFRLPKGILRTLVLLPLLLVTLAAPATNPFRRYADSLYACNVSQRYAEALLYADSALVQAQQMPDADLNTLLEVHNETAIAALALHRMDLYHLHNDLYTSLYKQTSRDTTLQHYNAHLQHLLAGIRVAIVLLLLLVILLIGLVLWHLQRIRRRQYDDLMQMQEDLHRLTYEADTLYLENEIMDNGLSTLKHETMYFPARIRRILPEREEALEVAEYYHTLFTLLYRQIQGTVKGCVLRLRTLDAVAVLRQVVTEAATSARHRGDVPRIQALLPKNPIPVRSDADVLPLLFETLQHLALTLTDAPLTWQIEEAENTVRFVLQTEEDNEDDNGNKTDNHPSGGTPHAADPLSSLFSPSSSHHEALLARQIIREHEDALGRSGLRIQAEPLHLSGFRLSFNLSTLNSQICPQDS